MSVPSGRSLTGLLAAVVTAALLPVVGLAPVVTASAADPGVLFTPLPGFDVRPGDDVRVQPRRAAAFRVDLAGLSGRLADAPTAAQVRRGAAPLSFSLPDPSGRLVTFRVEETRVMQQRLAAEHPEIRTWAGTGVTDPGTTIRLDLTPMGFHAAVVGLSGARSWYVDPAYNRPGTTTHLSYLRAAVPAPERGFVEPDLDAVREAVQSSRTASSRAGEVVTRRTYRLALVTEQSFAAHFGSANVTAQKATLINRVNQVYNNDLAIELVLVNGTDLLNLDTNAKAVEPNGPCGANACYDQTDLDDGCTGTLLNRNEFVLGQIIGADKFDIGHIGLGINGGGIAGLGVVGEQYKADGCTGLSIPEGDLYAVDYVAHEMGHQFGGNHTFNGSLVNCSLTNRNGDTSVEPGSGTSVMAYAGICGRDNTQPHSDPYFSQRSIDEITAHVTGGPSSYDEEQVVNLTGFDQPGESFQLTYPGASPVTITRGAGGNYNTVQLGLAVQTLTGFLPQVSGYDGANSPGVGGFTLDFGASGSGTDVDTLGVTGAGGVSGFVGTIYNGGDGTNQGVAATTSNHAPLVTAPANKTLPVRTPFTLTASGSDADGTTPTYLWEQNDVGLSPVQGSELLTNGKTDGPLFRVFGVAAQVSTEDSHQSPSPGQNNATSDPSRTFPDLMQVLSGNTNAATGDCPEPPAEPATVPQATIDCFSEYLPTPDYGDPVLGGEMNFRVTARDGALAGGGTAFDDVTLAVDPDAGPFRVSSRATAGQPAEGGTTETLTWAVNGTNAVGLAPNVKITLSTDGGLTYPEVLLASTANDGSQQITWPMVSTSAARIRIEAVGNYFFDVNDADFTLESTLGLSAVADQTVQYSDDFAAPITVTASSSEVDGDQLTASVDGVEGVTVTTGATSADGVVPGTRVFTLQGPVQEAVGDHDLVLTVKDAATAQAHIAQATIPVTVAPEEATVEWSGPLETSSPGPTADVPLETTVTDVADGTRGDVTTASVAFVDRDTDEVLCTAPVTGSTGATTGTAGCTAHLSVAGTETVYTIGTVVGGNYVRDAAADDTEITVVQGPPDTEAPDTTITSGPSAGGFFLKARATIRYDGGDDATSYVCRLDGRVVACGDGSVTLRRLSTHGHVFSVAARDAAGNLDLTPARRAFVSPYNDSQLDRRGRWIRKKASSAYRGTFLSSSRDGATLSRRATDVTQIALVVGTAPKLGRVAVFFRGEQLATVTLKANTTQGRLLVPVATFGRPRSGLVEIEVLGSRRVRIEGLGLR